MNGGEFYGKPEHNSLTFLKRYYEQYLEDADKGVLNIKGATKPGLSPDGRPNLWRRASSIASRCWVGKVALTFSNAHIEIPMFHSKKHWEPWQSW